MIGLGIRDGNLAGGVEFDCGVDSDHSGVSGAECSDGESGGKISPGGGSVEKSSGGSSSGCTGSGSKFDGGDREGHGMCFK